MEKGKRVELELAKKKIDISFPTVRKMPQINKSENYTATYTVTCHLSLSLPQLSGMQGDCSLAGQGSYVPSPSSIICLFV